MFGDCGEKQERETEERRTTGATSRQHVRVDVHEHLLDDVGCEHDEGERRKFPLRVVAVPNAVIALITGTAGTKPGLVFRKP